MNRLYAVDRSASVGVPPDNSRYLVLRKEGHTDAGAVDQLLSKEFPGLIYRNKLIPGKDQDGNDVMVPDPATARVDGVSVTPQEIVIAVNGKPTVDLRKSVIAALEKL